MISTLSATQSEFAEDLPVADSPSLHRRRIESEFSDNRRFVDRPSFLRRATRAFVRYLIAIAIGVAGTLAWQSYGDTAQEMVAGWAAQHGWSLAWLPYQPAARTSPQPGPDTTAESRRLSAGQLSAPSTAQSASVAPATREPVAPSPPAASSADLQQLQAMTLSLDAVKQKVEQLALGQQQMASDIARLQTADEEIRHKISAVPPKPAAAPASKPTPATAPSARAPMPLH